MSKSMQATALHSVADEKASEARLRSLDEEELDEYVIDLKLAEATDINNKGKDAQVSYITGSSHIERHTRTDNDTPQAARGVAGAALASALPAAVLPAEDNIITIEVDGGCVVDVTGLPPSYLYQVCDRDNCPDCGGLDKECVSCAGERS